QNANLPQVGILPGASGLRVTAVKTKLRQLVPSGVADYVPAGEVRRFLVRVERGNLSRSRGLRSDRGREDKTPRRGDYSLVIQIQRHGLAFLEAVRPQPQGDERLYPPGVVEGRVELGRAHRFSITVDVAGGAHVSLPYGVPQGL